MRKPNVYAEYNRCGYTVYVGAKGVVSAGNHRNDGAYHAPVGSPECVPLAKLRSFAIWTAREIADASKLKYTGVERIEDHE